jgi:multicopper oxidase
LASSVAAGAGAALAACGHSSAPAAPLQTQPTAVPTGLNAAIDAAEAVRPRSGKTVTVALTPRPVTVDLGGRVVNTLGYADTVPVGRMSATRSTLR